MRMQKIDGDNYPEVGVWKLFEWQPIHFSPLKNTNIGFGSLKTDIESDVHY